MTPLYSLSNSLLQIPNFLSSPELSFEIGFLGYTKGGKMLWENPPLFFLALWFVDFLGNPNNYQDLFTTDIISPHDDSEYFLTDFEGATITQSSKYQFTQIKKLLKAQGYIDYKPCKAEKVVSDGVTRYRNVKGSQYFPTDKLNSHLFDRTELLEIDLSLFRKETPVALKPRRRVKPKYTDLPVSICHEHTGCFEYTATLHITTLTEEMLDDLKQQECGKLLLSHKKNKRRLQGCLIILDLIYNAKDSKHEEWVTDFNFSEDLYFVSSDYVPLSQKVMKNYLNGDQISKCKDTLKALNWIESEPSVRRHDHKTNQSHKGESYNPLVKPKCYRLTHDYFSAIRSGSTIEITQKIDKIKTTPYKSLLDCTLGPKVFDIFEEVARTRHWHDDTKRKQKSQLINFDFHRGEFDQKKYSPDITNSRVNTFIGRLPKKFRDYILMDGEPTVEVDVSSAHALFISHFMGDCREKQEWIEVVSGGLFYEGLMEDLNLDPITLKGKREHQTRNLIKKIFSSYLNGCRRKEKFDDTIKLDINFSEFMDKKYPLLANTINELIYQYSCGGKNNNGAALKLQEVESDCVGTYFMCQNSDFECISIHDGVLVKEREADELIKAIQERCMEVVGVNVVVSRK